MTSKGYHWKVPPTTTKGFDVSKLAGGSNGYVNDSGATQLSLVQEQVVDRAVTEWPTGGNVQEKWEAVKPALTKSAEALLGTEDRCRPDWLCASADKLKPVLQQ